MTGPLPRAARRRSCGHWPTRTCSGLHALLLLLAATASAGAAPPADPTLRQIDALVAEHFYSPDVLRARQWRRHVARADRRLARLATPAQRGAEFQALLATLETSHTDYLPRDDPRYYDVASIFQRVIDAPQGQCARAQRRPESPVGVDAIGVWWRRVDAAWFVAGVLDDGPAQRAGLALGDEVARADGAPFAPVAAFAGKAGRTVRLDVRRARGGPLLAIDVVPRRSEPVPTYAAATRASARVIERGDRRIGYLRLWAGAGGGVREALLEGVRELNGAGVDGFVLDLRDGWGGVPPDFVSVFDRRVPVLATTTRDGPTYRFDRQIRVPAVVLINAGSRSGKEVFAHAVKAHALATLVGEPTAGAMLAGTPYCLDDGALLFLAVGTTTIDGAILEGRPVQPDVRVPFDVRWAQGRDPQLDAALELLTRS